MNGALNGAVWWREIVFYQIYMPSFCDSDGDGCSDFQGMTGKLDYLQSLGIKGIWLTPFLLSPKVDNGYDVASYTEIDPQYGSSEDFHQFLEEAHKRGIRVIIDMVFNHTSTDHAWFQESRQSKDNPYRDYYIWRDAPNNWESFFGGSAWEKDVHTNQYYYHKFDTRMADLNWANPKVREEIREVIRFWLRSGVDGFRLDVINFLTTDLQWNDNPVEDGKQVHLYDIDQPGVKHAMKLIKSTVHEFDQRFVVGEIGSDKLDVLVQYQSPDLMDVVFNFNFGSITQFSTERIFEELKNMDSVMPDYPTLFFGSHDMPRMSDRLADGDKDRIIALAAVMLLAKGVPFIYYGEEVGMENIHALYPDEIIDIQGRTQYMLALETGNTEEEALKKGNEHNRDKSRSPMQWNDDRFAGFSTHEPWIKINENYPVVNVEHQKRDVNSIWNAYRALIELRNKEKALQYGEYEKLELIHDRIIFSRMYGKEKITVIINFGEVVKMDLPADVTILMGNEILKTNQVLLYKEIH
ncbi:MAG TPA: alpha-glucosidase [Saprospiraceae bacterium]|nr:alpha-glucosidase [Saprospiraceae bacterium]